MFARSVLFAAVLVWGACTPVSRSSDLNLGPDGGLAGGWDAGDLLADVDLGSDGGGIDGGSPSEPSVDGGRPGVPYVYVGSGNGVIRRFTLDAGTGGLTLRGTTDGGVNPSWLALHPSGAFLYAVNEGSPGRVSAFSVDRSTGALTWVDDALSSGNGPAHLSVHRSGQWLFVANYGSGNVAVLPLGEDGKFGTVTDVEPSGANAHQILTDPSGTYVFVPCKGADLIAQYVFDTVQGTLTPNAVPSVATAMGAGPRHLAFHPTGPFAYGVNELDSTLTVYAFDAATGRLSSRQTVSTLPAGYGGSNTGAEVEVHPSGKFVYVSNRGHQSMASFAIQADDGKVSLVGHTATGGNTPRSFAIDPTGALLYVANQQSGSVYGFEVNATTGGLRSLGEVAQANTPAFVGFFVLPAP